MYQDDDNVMYATTHEYNSIRGFLKTSGGRILIAVLVGIVLGATLGGIAGSVRLAIGFGVGFGLISGLIFDSEVRRHPDTTDK